jgi:cytochrome c biogenesis protein CcmG/thiol:disulfide interchange protein DsbE
MKLQNIIPLIIFLGLAWFMTFATSLSDKPSFLPNMIGKQIEPFESTEVFNGKKFSSSELLQEPSILNLWASWCVSCQAEHETMLNLKSKGYKIYALDVADTPENAKKIIGKNGNPFYKLISDPKREISISLGATGTPETFVIGKDGKVYFHERGMIDNETIEKQIIPILNELKKK